MNDSFKWPDGRSCAVSLTYDDALPIHYEYVGPALEARGMLGTFYLLISGDPMKNFDRWKHLALQGHELGNHTLFHPCRRETPEMYSWMDDGFDLQDYTPYRFQQELRVANLFLHLLDGKQTRTYGATCCDTYIGRGRNKRSIEDLLREDFVAVRGRQTDKMITVSRDLNLMNLGHTGADFRSFATLRDEIAAAHKAGAWLVYHIHGIGPKTSELFIERHAHEHLLDYLSSQHDIWVTPFIKVASWIRQWQEEH